MLAQVRHRDGLPRQESCTAIGDDSVRATAGDRCRKGMVREDRDASPIEGGYFAVYTVSVCGSG